MKTPHVILIAVIALVCMGHSSMKCECLKGSAHTNQERLLRVKRWEVVTNVTQHFIIGRSDNPVLMTNYVTNVIIGTARKELFRAQSID